MAFVEYSKGNQNNNKSSNGKFKSFSDDYWNNRLKDVQIEKKQQKEKIIEDSLQQSLEYQKKSDFWSTPDRVIDSVVNKIKSKTDKSGAGLVVRGEQPKKPETVSYGDNSLEGALRESLAQTKEQVRLQETNPDGGLIGFVSSSRTAGRALTRGKQDEEYLKQIQENNKTIAEILNAKKRSPEKADKYDLMLKSLQEKNDILAQASGGDRKNKTFWQDVGLALSTTAELVPTLGAGITKGGLAAINSGRIIKGITPITQSLIKEGITFGGLSSAGDILENQKTKPAEILGSIASNIALSTIFNVAGGKLMNKFAEYLTGKKVIFTPKEKDVLQENVPELSNEDIFQQAGLDSPVVKTDEDLTAQTIAKTEDEAVIKDLIKDKVPEEDLSYVSKILKVVKDEDEVSRIIDEYDPVKKQENLAEKISMMDNEKRISGLLKGVVEEAEIPKVSRVLKNMEDTEDILKVLDEFKAKPVEPIVEPTATVADEVVPEKPPEPVFVEKSLNDSELADSLKNRELELTSKKYLDGSAVRVAKERVISSKYKSLKRRLEGKPNKAEVIEAKTFLEKKLPNKKITQEAVIKYTVQKAKSELSKLNNKFKRPTKVKVEVKDEPSKSKTVKSSEPKKETTKTTEKATKEAPVKDFKKEEPKTEQKQEEKLKKDKEKPTLQLDKPTVNPSGKKTKSGLSKSAVKRAVQRGLDKDYLDEITENPKLDTVSLNQQDEAVKELISSDFDRAIRIAKGEENPPKGLLFGRVRRGVLAVAEESNDYNLYSDIATSFESSEIGRILGQNVKAFDNRGFSDADKVMREVLKLKKDIAAKTGVDVKQVEKELNELIEKTSSGNKGLEALIDTIKCK